MIHPTAIVHKDANLAEDVEVGPFTVIGAHVEIGAGTSIGAHTVVAGRTRIGANNRIFHHVVLGEIPQDKKYAGEPTELEIGNGNTIREFCTFHTGTVQDAGLTRLGDDNSGSLGALRQHRIARTVDRQSQDVEAGTDVSDRAGRENTDLCGHGRIVYFRPAAG